MLLVYLGRPFYGGLEISKSHIWIKKRKEQKFSCNYNIWTKKCEERQIMSNTGTYRYIRCQLLSGKYRYIRCQLLSSVADTDPYMCVGLPDPDPLVRGKDLDP
jgi:hypothetical protein